MAHVPTDKILAHEWGGHDGDDREEVGDDDDKESSYPKAISNSRQPSGKANYGGGSFVSQKNSVKLYQGFRGEGKILVKGRRKAVPVAPPGHTTRPWGGHVGPQMPLAPSFGSLSLFF